MAVSFDNFSAFSAMDYYGLKDYRSWCRYVSEARTNLAKEAFILPETILSAIKSHHITKAVDKMLYLISSQQDRIDKDETEVIRLMGENKHLKELLRCQVEKREATDTLRYIKKKPRHKKEVKLSITEFFSKRK